MEKIEVIEYEAPEVIELGAAEEVTLGKFFGDWPDGILYTYAR